jgi:ATP-dependent DNA helicase RecG
METMVKTNDGFEISEVDLKLRGPGDIVGTQQSGMLDLKIADLVRDGQILQLARNAANVILDEDSEMKLPKNAPILNEFNRTKKRRIDWGRIS